MKNYILIFAVLFCTPILIFSQGETANWYFGNNAGIRFNNDGSTTVLTDGQLNTLEGCATISNDQGDLLFYTDGKRVYNRDHNLMENGSGLYGNASSTQSAIIVPRPDSTNIFYIFTVDVSLAEGDIDNGLNYSIVDLSYNGGNGRVIQKNINLLVDSSEKLSAVVKDCSDNSIWLITLASENGDENVFNTYHAFEINAVFGVIHTSVKSTFNDIDIEDPRGYLKFSPDGKKMASANMSSGLYIYDFDALTGTVSNQEQVFIQDEHKNAYGIEFSKNGNFLYVHSSNDVRGTNQPTGHSSSLLQFSLNDINMSSSEVVLHKDNMYRGALQLGNNGKIYRTIAVNYQTGTPYLGVIDEPNKKGTSANYLHNAVFLESRNATQGLPPFIQSFFSTIDLVSNEDGSTSGSLTICEGEPFKFEAEYSPGATYHWSKDGNPFPNPDNHIFEVNASEEIDAGRYTVEIIPSDARKCVIYGEVALAVNQSPEGNNLTLTQCDTGPSNLLDGLTSFNLNQIEKQNDFVYTFYESETDLLSDLPIDNPENFINSSPYHQTIYYKVSNQSNCSNSGEILLNVKDVVLNSDQYSFYSCDENPEDNVLVGNFDLETIKTDNFSGQNIKFYSSLEDVALEQNELDNWFTSESTTILGRIENNNQCEDVLQINLNVNPSPLFQMDEFYTICLNNPLLPVYAPEGFDSYTWIKKNENSETNIGSGENAIITEPGIYILEASYQYAQTSSTISCSNRVEFEVVPSNIAKIENLDIKDISTNNSVTIEVSGLGDYEYSLDGINYTDDNLFNNVPAGFNIVYVNDKNGCGVSEKLVSVAGYDKFFTPNADRNNDYWELKGLKNMKSVSIFDRYGQLIAFLNPQNPKWDGTSNNINVPSSDYWFKAKLEDGREFKGHFTLKR